MRKTSEDEIYQIPRTPSNRPNTQSAKLKSQPLRQSLWILRRQIRFLLSVEYFVMIGIILPFGA
jgi:hypothetical protein